MRMGNAVAIASAATDDDDDDDDGHNSNNNNENSLNDVNCRVNSVAMQPILTEEAKSAILSFTV